MCQRCEKERKKAGVTLARMLKDTQRKEIGEGHAEDGGKVHPSSADKLK